MLFNSPEFLVFLFISYTIYLFLPKLAKIPFLLAASFIFLARESPISIFLLFGLATLTYLVIRTKEKRTVFQHGIPLVISAALGTLAYFKYRHFISESMSSIFVNDSSSSYSTDIVIPLGISFFTFQLISYVVDVYRQQLTPERNYLRFLLYIAYFPQLLAGPIERGKNLLPQLHNPRTVSTERVLLSLNQIIWGFSKKLLIADQLEPFISSVFNNPADTPTLLLFITAPLYAIQIYCDFSGYIDIARGTSALFGIRLSQNFNFPYSASSLADFWNRWHMTLSTWFRDYLFFPLLFQAKFRLPVFLAIIVTFSLSGLWHGANWTFVIWGFTWGLALAIENFLSNRSDFYQMLTRSTPIGFKRALTFLFVCLTWVIFRSESLQGLKQYLNGMIFGQSGPLLSIPSLRTPAIILTSIAILAYLGFHLKRPEQLLFAFGRRMRFLILSVTFVFMAQLIIWFGHFEETAFIYFRF